MKKSRLIEVLKSLSNREMKALGEYLASPYFKKREGVVQLYEYIASALRSNDEAALDKKNTYQKLFSKQAYNDVALRLIMSSLLQQVEEFLALQRYQADEMTKNIYLAQSYRHRKLAKSFQHTLKNARNTQQKNPSYSADVQFRRSLLHAEEYHFLLEENRQGERDLQTWHDALNHFFIAETLKQACTMLTHERVAEKTHNFLLLPDILKHIAAQPSLLEIPAIQLYYHSYHTIIGTQNEEHFHKLKAGIILYGVGFSLAELKEIYTHAINHCIRQNNKKEDTVFLRELFDLYQVGLSQDAFLENGFLSRWTYKNIVTAGLMLEEFDWVEGFIYEYESRLERKYRKDSFAYNLACFFYGKKQYDRAILQLHQIKFDDVFLNLNARNLLLKIYLELEEYEALDSHLNSFEIFIRRKKITNPHRDNYLNIIKLSRKIIQLNPHDKAAKAALRKEIEAEKNPSTRGFLLEILK